MATEPINIVGANLPLKIIIDLRTFQNALQFNYS
jgi:hypothetical protein